MENKCSSCGRGEGQISFLLSQSCDNCQWGKGKEFCSDCFRKHENDFQEHKRSCLTKNNSINCLGCNKQIKENERGYSNGICGNCSDKTDQLNREEISSMKCPRCQKNVLSLSRWDKNVKRDGYSELVCDNCYKQLDSKSLPSINQPQQTSSGDISSVQALYTRKSFTTKVYEFYQTPTFWWIAGIVGVIDLIYLYFYFFEREKLRESLKKNTLLKILTYLLAIASVVILVIPIIFLLASAGGRKRICSRCRRLEQNCVC